MRCLVFGAGAVGGYLGAKLIQAGWQVTFLGRPETAQAWQNDGLILTEPTSSQHLGNIKTIHRWPPTDSFKPELILLTVKAFDCRQAAEQINQTDWQTPVISFINGVGSEAILREQLPARSEIMAGTLTTAVERVGNNEINVTKPRGVGLPKKRGVSQNLASALEGAGVKIAQYSDTESMKWSKLVSNLIGSATAALTGLSVAQIYSHPGLFRLELAALREVQRVMTAAGFQSLNLPGVPIRWLQRILILPAWLLKPLLHRLVASGRGGKRPSMYYDVIRGRTEIEWLHGAVAKKADEIDLISPATRMLTKEVLSLPAGTRLPVETLLARAAAAGVPGIAGYNRPE